MTASRICAAAAVCLSVSCSGDSTAPLEDLGPVPEGHFTTDATGYRAEAIPGPYGPRYRFTVITSFENRGASTVYLGRCYADSPRPVFSVTMAEPAGDESAYEQVWACVGHDQQFAIVPAAVRVDTFVVEGPNSWDGRTHQPFGVTTGIFRMYFDVRTSPGDGAPEAPLSQRLSNQFIVQKD